MAKKLLIHKSHEEAERYVLEQGFERTPEERILWLLKQIKRMHKYSPVKKQPKGYVLKKLESKEE
ncbi:hypothetical protein [Roseivirga pacifica]|jgi:hypothetical protein|uniref:hypothetical protein n=1 Tax=Roseivirga pacifica TaxID=1267423 RepID=UPI003BA87FB4